MSTATDRDRRHAEAFRDLEGAIGALRDMSALLDMAAHDTVFQAEGDIAKRIRQVSGITGYHLLILSQDQSRGLDYAIGHLCDLVNTLYSHYHEGHDNSCA